MVGKWWDNEINMSYRHISDIKKLMEIIKHISPTKTVLNHGRVKKNGELAYAVKNST